MKRFTETIKWETPWFQQLSPEMKCFWMFICDRCDNAGVWEPNWLLVSFFLGKKIDDACLKDFNGRIEQLPCGKLWIPSFIDFQYGKLSRDCRPHLKIFELLNKHGIDYCEDQTLVIRSRAGRVSNGKRKYIYERDGNKCVYCGSENELEPDHIVPKKLGGSDEISNLLTACHTCNTRKNDKPIDVFLANHPSKNRVLEYLDTLSRNSDTLQDKEEDKDKEEDARTSEGQKISTPSKTLEIPDELSNELKASLRLWLEYKRQRKEPYVQAGWAALITKLSKYPAAVAVAAIEKSMASNYAGIFPDSINQNHANHKPNPRADETLNAGRVYPTSLILGGRKQGAA